MTPSLFDLIGFWLRSYGRGIRPGIIFHTDYGFGGLIRCSRCECFIAFIDKDHLLLRLGGVDCKRILAAEPDFLSVLTDHLKVHVCDR